MEERTRITLELHDVVSHGVSAIAVQSDAADVALERDPELVRAPLQAIRASARDALAEMRRMVAVLRPAGDEAELAPVPRVGDLPELLERVRDTGTAVTLEETGTPWPFAAKLGPVGLPHHPGRAHEPPQAAPGAPAVVQLTWSENELRIEVENRGMPGVARLTEATSGHGIIGMRERVRLHRGELTLGPTDDGGFSVAAMLPLDVRQSRRS